MSYGLKVYDALVGKAISAVGLASVMVVTGLSQVPFEGYEGRSGFYLYRPYDHHQLFDKLGIEVERIAPLMSRDMMLYFADDGQRDRALRRLGSARVLGKSLFQCTAESESRLFCKVSYSFDAPDGTVIDVEDVEPGSMLFSDFFLLITFKTGHHSPSGVIIAPNAAFAQSRPPATVQLETLPAMIFRTMRIDDHEVLAKDLLFSPA